MDFNFFYHSTRGLNQTIFTRFAQIRPAQHGPNKPQSLRGNLRTMRRYILLRRSLLLELWQLGNILSRLLFKFLLAGRTTEINLLAFILCENGLVDGTTHNRTGGLL